MPDKLTELFNTWSVDNPAGDLFQAFQGGLSAGSFSTRMRAVAIVQKAQISNDEKNELLTAIGTLSDIPE
jgi:hypothetical protein